MNQYLGQKFTTLVKINCLNTILKSRNGIPCPYTVHEWLILLEMQHTDSIDSFKMADKVARNEGHRQVFVEYLNEVAYSWRVLLFCLMKTWQKLLLSQYCPLKIKIIFWPIAWGVQKYWFWITFNHTFIQFLKRIAQWTSGLLVTKISFGRIHI